MDRIHDFLRQCKSLIESVEKRDELVIIFIIVLVGFGSFGLGRLSKTEEMKGPIRVEYPKDIQNGNAVQRAPAAVSSSIPSVTDRSGAVVGSKNGVKYHFPWCSGAQRIKEENKIWFPTEEDARKAGYTPAGNCKGISD